MENAERVNKMYEARKNNEEYPLGHLDDGGARWYPSFEEKQPCCDKIRGPSRNYPNNYLNHCKTKKHIVYVVAQQVRIERLEEAVKKGDIENIKSVVEEEIKNSPYKKIDSAFSHPLHVAIEAMKASKMDAPDIIKCLLEKGADLDHTTDGVTFDHNGKKMHEPSGLHLAVSRNLPETVKVLLEHGADTRLTVKKIANVLQQLIWQQRWDMIILFRFWLILTKKA